MNSNTNLKIKLLISIGNIRWQGGGGVKNIFTNEGGVNDVFFTNPPKN